MICIHCCLDDSNLGAEVTDWNRKYRSAVDECLVQLSVKVIFVLLVHYQIAVFRTIVIFENMALTAISRVLDKLFCWIIVSFYGFLY